MAINPADIMRKANLSQDITNLVVKGAKNPDEGAKVLLDALLTLVANSMRDDSGETVYEWVKGAIDGIQQADPSGGAVFVAPRNRTAAQRAAAARFENGALGQSVRQALGIAEPRKAD